MRIFLPDNQVSAQSHKLTIGPIVAKSFKQTGLQVKENSAEFRQHVEEVLYCERALLATLNFDLNVVTAHEHIMAYLTVMHSHIPSSDRVTLPTATPVNCVAQ